MELTKEGSLERIEGLLERLITKGLLQRRLLDRKLIREESI